MARRVLVIGAGPIGLAAAYAAVERGHEVVVLEAAEVGSALCRWGPTRFFTPLAMNLPARLLERLGPERPPADALLTGPEMAERVLRPLALLPELAGRIRTGHRVTAVGRRGMTRLELPGHPLRAERPFRVLAATPQGETVFEADVVLDASGVTGRPSFAGAGGLPARGEASCGAGILRDLGALEETRAALAGGRVLVVGHGHSAATAVLRLCAGPAPRPRAVTWAVRASNRRPCAEIASDPLPERARIASGANDLAQTPSSSLTVLRGTSVEAIAPENGGYRVELSGGRADEFDAVVSLTGYRPDLSFLSELPLEISPATEGAGRLARALANVTDCLAAPRLAPRDLDSGEPGFALVGAKSYGRARSFLLQSGLEHLETILDAFSGS